MVRRLAVLELLVAPLVAHTVAAEVVSAAVALMAGLETAAQAWLAKRLARDLRQRVANQPAELSLGSLVETVVAAQHLGYLVDFALADSCLEGAHLNVSLTTVSVVKSQLHRVDHCRAWLWKPRAPVSTRLNRCCSLTIV